MMITKALQAIRKFYQDRDAPKLSIPALFPDPAPREKPIGDPISSLRKEKSSLPVEGKEVDLSTFRALVLAQYAINSVRECSLPYGSYNQILDLENPRGGSIAGDVFTRGRQSRLVKDYLFGEQFALHGKDLENFRVGITAGLGTYYKAGNCGEHAVNVYSWLSAYLPPEFKVQLVNSNNRYNDHAYCRILWKEKNTKGEEEWCKNPVIADAWAVHAQACRWSEFLANPNLIPSVSKEWINKPFIVLAEHEKKSDNSLANDKNLGDIIGDAFRNIKPGKISYVPAENSVRHLSIHELDAAKRSERNYHRWWTIISSKGKFIDYCYGGQKLSDFGMLEKIDGKLMYVDGARELPAGSLPSPLKSMGKGSALRMTSPFSGLDLQKKDGTRWTRADSSAVYDFAAVRDVKKDEDGSLIFQHRGEGTHKRKCFNFYYRKPKWKSYMMPIGELERGAALQGVEKNRHAEAFQKLQTAELENKEASISMRGPRLLVETRPRPQQSRRSHIR